MAATELYTVSTRSTVKRTSPTPSIDVSTTKPCSHPPCKYRTTPATNWQSYVMPSTRPLQTEENYKQPHYGAVPVAQQTLRRLLGYSVPGDRWIEHTSSAQCQDSHGLCSKWAFDGKVLFIQLLYTLAGECARNPYWMNMHCQVSCNCCHCTYHSVGMLMPQGEC